MDKGSKKVRKRSGNNTNSNKKVAKKNIKKSLDNNIGKNVEKSNVKKEKLEKIKMIKPKIKMIKPKKSKIKVTIRKKENNKIENNETEYNQNESNKIYKKSKKSKKAIILITFIILMLSIIAASYVLIKTPKFNITSISVLGNSKVDVNSIITNSSINIGDNIFLSVLKINKNSILNVPYISKVKVSIKFPSEFIINVTERKSIYFAYNKEKNLYYKLDGEGVILETCDNISLKATELLINGITFDDEVKINTKINDIDYSKILVYRKIQEEFNNKFPEKKITKVTFENSLTKIYLDDKIEVILPNDTNLKYNSTFLKDIISNVGDVQGTIDMTKESPTFTNFIY